MQKALFRQYYEDILEAYASPHHFEMRLDLLLLAFQRNEFLDGQLDLVRQFLYELIAQANSFLAEINEHPIHYRFWNANVDLAKRLERKLRNQEGS